MNHRLNLVFRWLCVLAGAGVLCACGATPAPVIGLSATRPVAVLGQSGYALDHPAEYLLRPTDEITVTVFREPDLSIEKVPIGVDGSISLPLIGPVRAEGRTTTQLAEEVKSKLAAGLLTRPRVSVNIANYASHVVTVEGAVEHSGVFEFKPGTRLSGAIALASGPSRVAKSDQIAVFRQTPEGIAVAKFDLDAMRQGAMIDPLLEPGDRVVVGISGLSQFWQDFLKAIPLFALFTTI